MLTHRRESAGTILSTKYVRRDATELTGIEIRCETNMGANLCNLSYIWITDSNECLFTGIRDNK